MEQSISCPWIWHLAQVGMAPTTQEKTAFTTHTGLYEFQVMLFGKCNVPATFQRLMKNILVDIACDKCRIFLYDNLVISRSLEEHLSKLREVVTWLQRAGLKLKPNKCRLMKDEVEYLGHMVSQHVVSKRTQRK